MAEVEKRASLPAEPEAEGFLKAVWNLASDSLGNSSHNSPTAPQVQLDPLEQTGAARRRAAIAARSLAFESAVELRAATARLDRSHARGWLAHGRRPRSALPLRPQESADARPLVAEKSKSKIEHAEPGAADG